MHKWQNLFVRDLAWTISTPCIIEHKTIPNHEFFTREYQQFLPILEHLDKNPQELVDFLNKTKRAALGNYFEDLIEFWLSKRADTKILVRNLQIVKDKQTLGECDFIADINNKVTHIEVAIKYYLGIKNSAAQEFWVGRGLTDRLDIKFHKLFAQQLELSNSKAMIRQLAKHNIAPIEAKMAIVKGFFFKHYFTPHHAVPKHAPKDLQKSFWCSLAETDSLPTHYKNWQLLSKPHWLTYDDMTFDKTKLKDKAEEYFDSVKNTPVLCNAFSKNQVAPIKFFIAPNFW